MRVRVIGSQLYIINQLREKERSKLCETEKFPFFLFLFCFLKTGVYTRIFGPQNLSKKPVPLY